MTESCETTIPLPEALHELQQVWKELRHNERDVFYARSFAPVFIPHFKSLPLSGASRESINERPKALISILGLSWQPVALMASWVEPERMLIIGTQESINKSVDEENVVELICRLAGLRRHLVDVREVSDESELEIYKEVNSFSQKHKYAGADLAVDPTGGKKSMSVSAALAGFLLNSRIMYVDYGRYFERAPLAGTEYPRILHNPLEIFGDREAERIMHAFDRGDYGHAVDLAQEFADRLKDPRPALLLSISQAYNAWNQFQFSKAKSFFDIAIQIADNNAHSLGQKDMATCRTVLTAHRRVVEQLDAVPDSPLSIEQGFPLIVNHLAAAIRHRKEARLSLSILLLYSSLERFCDLLLWCQYGIADREPDFNSPTFVSAFQQERFQSVGNQLHGKAYQSRPLENINEISLSTGIQLLATLDPQMFLKDDLGILKNKLMAARNRCEYEHGVKTQPLTDEEIGFNESRVLMILDRFCKRSGLSDLAQQIQRFSFPNLREIFNY